MAENTNYYYAMSDKALLSLIGHFIQETRISQNKTQQQTADAAGIDRSTLVQIENGRGATLLSLLPVLRVLQQLHWFKYLEIQPQVSPLLLAKLEQSKRKRVRNDGNEESNSQSSW
jgi:DNA-binding XRE family transcriptional regulator